jgi:hypothetical protein
VAIRTSRIVFGAAALSLIVLVVAWAAYYGPLRSPEAAFRDFANPEKRPEALLRDPLIRAGPRVLPLVLDAIKDRNFRLRRYAIGHLGCERYAPALPALERIVADPTEQDYFRGDALIAIWQIDRKRGEALVQEYAGAQDYLGSTARELRGNRKYADDLCLAEP